MLNTKTFAAALLAGTLGAGTFAASTTPAAARTEHRCDRYSCWKVHCDWRDNYCRRITGTFYARRHYYGRSRYRHARRYWYHHQWIPYDREGGRRHWTCNRWGHHCRWTYESY